MTGQVPQTREEFERKGEVPPWESFRRYGDLRVTQLGIANNVGLGLALALLGFIGNTLRPASGLELDAGLRARLVVALWLAVASVLLGALVTVSRLLDFRISHAVTRRRWSLHRMKLGNRPLTADVGCDEQELECANRRARWQVKWLGRTTYTLLFLQGLAAVLALLRLVVTLT